MVQIDTWEEATAGELSDFYNRQIARIPLCFAVASDEFQRGFEYRVNPWPNEEGKDGLEGHSQRQLLVAREGGEVVGFADMGRQLEEKGPACGLIRCLLYEPGQRRAGQALLEEAEAYFRGLGLAQVKAFTQGTYPFFQFGYGALSQTLGHVHALFGINGYQVARFANDGLPQGWKMYRRALEKVSCPEAPAADIEIKIQHPASRGQRPNLAVELCRGGDLLAVGWSSAAESHCLTAAARPLFITDEIQVIQKDNYGRGWGRYLLLRTWWEMQQLGYTQACLGCSLGNYRAHLLYTNLGYEVVDGSSAWCKEL
ncbi:MAG: GNAT family N-acetyltransferase [Candidatus Latescibacteria bacterium]|nr:GNAT family N-acetyltransferase [Candidatus Latescibacterota bacterium]